MVYGPRVFMMRSNLLNICIFFSGEHLLSWFFHACDVEEPPLLWMYDTTFESSKKSARTRGV